MGIDITVRHGDFAESVSERARALAQALCDGFPGVESVHVILDVEKHRKLAEAVVQGAAHTRVEAREEADEILAALDAAMEKVEKQLRRRWDRLVDHKADPRVADAEAVLGGSEP